MCARQILLNAFSLGIHFDGYTILTGYLQDDDSACVNLGYRTTSYIHNRFISECVFLDGSLFVCIYVAEQAASMQDCCLASLKIYLFGGCANGLHNIPLWWMCTWVVTPIFSA